MDIAKLLNQDNLGHVEEINLGWSVDKKYYIEMNNGEELQLRMTPINQFARKVVEFDAMEELYFKGLPIPEPLDIKGVEEEVYTLLRWVPGENANEVIPALREEEQYQLGYKSGRILKQIHTVIKVPVDLKSWDESYGHKIDQTIKDYLSCPLQYDNEDLFLKYIEKNRSLILERPHVFQHGDYHTGNVILSKGNDLSIIDFNRWDYGDPWEEFNRIDFTAQTSSLFATGQLDGYFKGQPPVLFFRLLLLYLSVNTLRALPWATNYSETEVFRMREKAKDILQWTDDLNKYIPSWYDTKALQRYKISD